MPGEFHEAQHGYYPIHQLGEGLRENGTEASVGRVAVSNPVVNPTIIPSTVPIPFPSARDPAPKVLQLKVAVPKTGQKSPFATRGCP